MKLTLNQLLELVGAALRSASSGGFAENATLRKIDQTRLLAARTGMSGVEVEIPRSTMSEEGKQTLRKLTRQPCG